MRGCAVGALLALYGQRDNLSPLHDFTERFAERFKELVNDVDEAVAIRGVSSCCCSSRALRLLHLCAAQQQPPCMSHSACALCVHALRALCFL